MPNLPPPPTRGPLQRAQRPAISVPRLAEDENTQVNTIENEKAETTQGRAPLPPKPISLPRTRKDPSRQCDSPKLLRSSASAVPSSNSLPKAIKPGCIKVEAPQRCSSATVTEDVAQPKTPESEAKRPSPLPLLLSEKAPHVLGANKSISESHSFTFSGPPKSLAPRPSSMVILQGTIHTDFTSSLSEKQDGREDQKEGQETQSRSDAINQQSSQPKQLSPPGNVGIQKQLPLPPRKKPTYRLSREIGLSSENKPSTPSPQPLSKSSSQTLPPPPINGEPSGKPNNLHHLQLPGIHAPTPPESPRQQTLSTGRQTPIRGQHDTLSPSPSSSPQSTPNILPPPLQQHNSLADHGVDIPPPPALPQGMNNKIPPPPNGNTVSFGSEAPEDAIFVTTSQHTFLRAATLPRLCLYVLSGEMTEGDADIIHSIAYTFEDFSTLEEFLSCLIETYKTLEAEHNKSAATKLIEFFLAVSMHQRSILTESMPKIENIIKKGLGNGSLTAKILQLLSSGCNFIPPLKLISLKRGISDPAFAEQITLIEWRYFVSIKNTEFAAYVRDNKNKSAFLNLNKLITWTNLFSLWLSVQILNENSASKRAAAIGKAITLAENLRQMHNYNGVMEVYSSLTHSALYRLKQSWEKVGKKQFEGFKALETLFSPDKNMSFYRQELHDAPYPKMPFVGFFLTDLMFVNDGFPKDTIDVNGKPLINVEKWKKFGKVLTELLACREYDHYTFEGGKGTIAADSPTAVLRSVAGGIGSANFFDEQGEPAYTDAQLIEISRKVEPRQQS